MTIKYTQILTLLGIFFILQKGQSQTVKIDTIPFTLDQKLLVFKGQINNEEIAFAFDTGAQSGVANSKNIEKASIKILKQGTNISDANNKTKRISDIKIANMTIGSYIFNDLKDHSADMAFLHCADLYLLGQNVIKKLNWKFDFDKMELYVSKNPFELAQNEIVWPITSYKGNRPHINYSLGSKTYKNLLVDTGFTGIFELDSTNSEFLEIYSQKQKSGKSHEIITSSMGLMGLGKPSLNRHFRIDSLFINQTLFSDLPVVINPSAEPKIGIYFFHNYCKTTTFNFSNNTILLDLRPQKLDEKPLLDGRVSIQNGKFIITAKAIGNNSSIKELNINDEILTVNNKRVSDFKDECEFLLWMYLFKEPELTLEKLNGQKIILKRWSWN